MVDALTLPRHASRCRCMEAKQVVERRLIYFASVGAFFPFGDPGLGRVDLLLVRCIVQRCS
jgi:hypothetical protein